MLNRFMNWLVPKLENWCEKTGRIRIIYNNHPDEGDIYLIRYFLFYSRWFSIYIHRFMMSDLSVPHDHPFDFVGYIVKGQYEEETLDMEHVRLYANTDNTLDLENSYFHNDFYRTSMSIRKQGSWAYRPRSHAHVVRIDRQYLLEEKDKAPLTVIFRGPYKRNWGFWDTHDKDHFKWSYHKTYLTGVETVQCSPKDSEIEMRVKHGL